MKRAQKLISIILMVTMLIGVISIFPASVSAGSWTIRDTLPTSSDSGWKYYSSPLNTFPLSPYNGGNCTWYAFGRAYEVFGTNPGLRSAGDAGNWYSYAKNNGFSVGSTPKAGSIICWSTHVGFVESVSGSTVTWTESNYQYNASSSISNFKLYSSSHPDTYCSKYGGVLLGYIYLGGTSSPSYTYSSIESGEYYLKNVATGKYLAVDGGKDVQEQNISVANYTGGNEMKLSISAASSGYKMRPMCSTSRLVNPYADNVVSGKNVCLYNDVNDNTQWWKFESVSGGYIIHNVQNESCVLDVDGTNVKVSTRTGANSQVWVLEPVNKVVYPGKPTLNVRTVSSAEYTQFWWDATSNTDVYEIKIHDASTGERVYYYTWIIETSYQAKLEAGTYTAYLVSVDNDLRDTDCWWTTGDSVTFTVREEDDIAPCTSVDYEKNTYLLFDAIMPWTEAKAYCESIGGHLVTISSHGEFDMIKELVSYGDYAVYWLGYSDAESEGDFVPVTDENGMYINWAEGEPNDYATGEDYAVIINNTSFEYNDVMNMYSTYTVGFICEFEHTHEYEVTEEMPANCTYSGRKTYTCSCGDFYMETFDPVATEHVFNEEATVLRVANETETGFGCHLCIHCNAQGRYFTYDIYGNVEYFDEDDNQNSDSGNDTDGEIVRVFTYLDAEIDPSYGDITFSWSAIEGADSYTLDIYNHDLDKVYTKIVTDLSCVWTELEENSGMFCITAKDANGKILAESGFKEFVRQLVSGNAEDIYGDVDANGKVNIKDATAIQKYIAKITDLTPRDITVADVNADEKVNVKDATTIQKYCANIATESRVGHAVAMAGGYYELEVIW